MKMSRRTRLNVIAPADSLRSDIPSYANKFVACICQFSRIKMMFICGLCDYASDQPNYNSTHKQAHAPYAMTLRAMGSAL